MKPSVLLLIIGLVGLFILSSGCTTQPPLSIAPTTVSTPDLTLIPTTGPITTPPINITFSGIATYVNLEGGFWGFIADDGTRYVPVNLPEDAPLEEGSWVVVTAVPVEVSTSQIWGTPIRVTEIFAKVSPNPSPIPTAVVGH